MSAPRQQFPRDPGEPPGDGVVPSGRAPLGPIRVAPVLLAVVAALAVVGYVVGLGDGRIRADQPDGAGRIATERTAPVDDAAPESIPSTSYLAMASRVHWPNHDWQTRLDTLVFAGTDPAAVPPSDPAVTRASLSRRAVSRAFNGAPPTIPHRVDQRSDESCLFCHNGGMIVDGRTVARMPHALLPQCTQCHVSLQGTPFTGEPLALNSFHGLPAPTGGDRAWPGAPPVIPHTTLQRTNCLACHGPDAWPGLRTTHPLRSDCLQCHAPSAELDQLPMLSAPWRTTARGVPR